MFNTYSLNPTNFTNKQISSAKKKKKKETKNLPNDLPKFPLNDK